VTTRPNFTFDEASHTYRVDGEVLPSVSTILRPIVSFDGIPAEVLSAAAARGVAVHKACELDDLGDLIEESVDPSIAGYLEAWRKFRRELRAEVFDTEQRRYHSIQRYAGTRDAIVRIGRRLWLIDRKTSAAAPWHAIQLAGYQLLAEDNGEAVDKVGTVLLAADGSYKLIEYGAAADRRVFTALVTLHKWRASNV